MTCGKSNKIGRKGELLIKVYVSIQRKRDKMERDALKRNNLAVIFDGYEGEKKCLVENLEKLVG
jgi:hypothetical protein